MQRAICGDGTCFCQKETSYRLPKSLADEAAPSDLEAVPHPNGNMKSSARMMFGLFGLFGLFDSERLRAIARFSVEVRTRALCHVRDSWFGRLTVKLNWGVSSGSVLLRRYEHYVPEFLLRQ